MIAYKHIIEGTVHPEPNYFRMEMMAAWLRFSEFYLDVAVPVEMGLDMCYYHKHGVFNRSSCPYDEWETLAMLLCAEDTYTQLRLQLLLPVGVTI